jgi:hypothetical protein
MLSVLIQDDYSACWQSFQTLIPLDKPDRSSCKLIDMTSESNDILLGVNARYPKYELRCCDSRC